MTMAAPGVQIGLLAAGIGSMALYLFWLFIFLRLVRPALASALGRLLGTPIHEQGRGQWAVQGSSSTGCATSLMDIVILLGGVLGPLLLVSCIFFTIFGP